MLEHTTAVPKVSDASRQVDREPEPRQRDGETRDLEAPSLSGSYSSIPSAPRATVSRSGRLRLSLAALGVGRCRGGGAVDRARWEATASIVATLAERGTAEVKIRAKKP
jgi:hypothetical protein